MNDKDCLTCIFMHEQQIMDAQGQPVIGAKLNTCRRMPPTAVITPSGGPGVSIGSQFPPVGAGIYCFEYQSTADPN